MDTQIEKENREFVRKVAVFLKKNNSSDMPHPDICWIVSDSGRKIVSLKNDLLLFSSEEKSERFIKNFFPVGLSFSTRSFRWDEIISKFSPHFELAILDYNGENEHLYLPLKIIE